VPLSLRPKDTILTGILSPPLASTILTDISPVSGLRMLSEAFAAELADLYYALFTLEDSFYLTTSKGIDKDTRGQDVGLVRDPGQAASDPVTFTRVATWLDDILLPAPQVLQALLSDGTVVLYRSLGDATLTPNGRSVSGQTPGISTAGGVTDQIRVNVNGDGAQTVTLGTLASGAAIAAAIQAAVRAMTPVTPANQPAFTTFRCDYGVTNTGRYTLRSGTGGPTASVVVTPGTTHSAAAVLKLGLANGGAEAVGQDSVDVPVVCDVVGVIGNVGTEQIREQATPVAGILGVANALMFSNGREPASDDAYGQDIQSYLLSLSRGTPDAVERAVYQTLGSDGRRHVLSAEVLYGAGTIRVFVCDGRSLTVGAQEDVRQDVENELLGLGASGQQWVAAGTEVGVVPATVFQVDMVLTVSVGPTPDLEFAKQAIEQALYALLYGWPIDEPLAYVQAARRVDETVVEMLRLDFTSPANFATWPIQALQGRKLMPGVMAVTVVRA
jgi:hypothetical protein